MGLAPRSGKNTATRECVLLCYSGGPSQLTSLNRFRISGAANKF